MASITKNFVAIRAEILPWGYKHWFWHEDSLDYTWKVQSRSHSKISPKPSWIRKYLTWQIEDYVTIGLDFAMPLYYSTKGETWTWNTKPNAANPQTPSKQKRKNTWMRWRCGLVFLVNIQAGHLSCCSLVCWYQQTLISRYGKLVSLCFSSSLEKDTK